MSRTIFARSSVIGLALVGMTLAACGSATPPASSPASSPTSATVAASPSAASPASSPAASDSHGQLPATYTIPGNPSGSKFEGIGADETRGVFYVSEVTGGQIYRGEVGKAELTQWLPAGADGRGTARGITTDTQGRVYIAGGPNGLDDPNKPDLWVYSPDGTLLASLRAPGTEVFLNDVAIGPDGAAYFTNSNAAQIFRVAAVDGTFAVTLWADASATITRAEGFNLGGIVLSPDQSAFVVAQGNTGALWRFAVKDGAVSPITGGSGLTDADGLVLQGSTLTVVRNFVRMVNTMELSADGTAVTPVTEVASSPDRVLTTAKEIGGRILYVDSHFDDKPHGIPPYEIVTNPSS